MTLKEAENHIDAIATDLALTDKIFARTEINQPLFDACEKSIGVNQLSLF